MGSMKDDLNDIRRDEQVMAVLDRVQELTWALLDEGITDDEFSLLDTLLLSDDKARERYVECVQLHTDLLTHFAPNQKTADSKSTVLSLLDLGSSVDVPSTHTPN